MRTRSQSFVARSLRLASSTPRTMERIESATVIEPLSVPMNKVLIAADAQRAALDVSANADRVTNRGVGDESRQPFRRQIADLAEADDDCAGRVRSRHGENLHRTGRARIDVEIQPAAEASAKSDVECRLRADDRVVAVVADGDGILRLAQVAVQHGNRQWIDERHRTDGAGGGFDQLDRRDDFREGVFAALQLLVRRPHDGGRTRRLAGEEAQADFDRVRRRDELGVRTCR